jgi:hypothetical protein
VVAQAQPSGARFGLPLTLLLALPLLTFLRSRSRAVAMRASSASGDSLLALGAVALGLLRTADRLGALPIRELI